MRGFIRLMQIVCTEYIMYLIKNIQSTLDYRLKLRLIQSSILLLRIINYKQRYRCEAEDTIFPVILYNDLSVGTTVSRKIRSLCDDVLLRETIYSLRLDLSRQLDPSRREQERTSIKDKWQIVIEEDERNVLHRKAGTCASFLRALGTFMALFLRQVLACDLLHHRPSPALLCSYQSAWQCLRANSIKEKGITEILARYSVMQREREISSYKDQKTNHQ